MCERERRMGNIALLVVDVQNALISEHPYQEQRVIKSIQKLIDTARTNQKEVIYVRHDDGPGTEFEYGTVGWQIYEAVAPEEGEFIVDKRYNSAFHKTDLKGYLDSKQVDAIMLTGLQTEYCIDATLRSAFDHEYSIIVPEGTNSTFSNEYLTGEKLYEYYNFKIWNNRYAKVVTLEEAIALLKQ